jgi:hypothetical protein
VLTTWHTAPLISGMQSAIGRLLAAIDEIEEDTKAILWILVQALDTSQGM